MAISAQLKRDANAAVQEVIDRHVYENKETGVQVCAFVDGETVVDAWAGVTQAGGSQKVDGNTLFNVFSVSKAVCDVALWIQIERGLVELDAPVAKYWPEFAQNGKSACTVRHVLYHRSGVPHMPEGTTPLTICDWNWVTDGLARISPLFQPGTRGAYACIAQGFILGEIVRRTDPKGRSYRQFVQDEIAKPLGATDLHHGIPDEVEPRVAIMDEPEKTSYWEEDSWFRKSIPAAVDLGKEVWEKPMLRRATVPSTGGIYNARSEARFWAMLAGGGQIEGKRILSQETVQGFLKPGPAARRQFGPGDSYALHSAGCRGNLALHAFSARASRTRFSRSDQTWLRTFHRLGRRGQRLRRCDLP